MRFKIIFLAVLAVLLALSFQRNSGQVIFFVAGYRLDLSWNFFLIAWLLSGAVIFFLFNTIRRLSELPERARRYQQGQKKERAYQSLYLAMRYFYDGRFGQALKHAQQTRLNPDLQSSADLLAAQAAHRLLQFTERDRLLELGQHPKDAQHAVLIARAGFALEDRQYVLALQLLEQAKKIGGRHLYALQLELKVRQRLGQWESVLSLIANLKKYRALLPIIEQKYAEQAYVALFAEASDDKAVRTRWRKMARNYQAQAEIATAAAARLIDFADYAEAHKILLEAIKETGPSADLMRQYARLAQDSRHLPDYLKQCEAWLSHYPQPLEILIALGQMCIGQKLWGKAQVYLEKALRLAAHTPERLRAVHLLLAQLYELDGQERPALITEHYRAAAQLP